MTEIWKDIKGSIYQVSDRGRVRNAKTKKVRTLSTNKSGYKVITLKVYGKYKNFKVHRLVARAFLPNPKLLPVVNHKDTIRSNNRVSNLEWTTHSENLKHSYRMGNRSNKGMKNPSFKSERLRLVHPDYGVECLTRQGYIKKYKLDPSSISKLVKGSIKSHRKWIYQPYRRNNLK